MSDIVHEFVVLKGSTARAESVPSAHRYMATKRQTLIASGVLAPEANSLRFTEDYLFDSPSGAAMLVLGRTSNGWNDWKTADGKTLNELERRAVGEVTTVGFSLTASGSRLTVNWR